MRVAFISVPRLATVTMRRLAAGLALLVVASVTAGAVAATGTVHGSGDRLAVHLAADGDAVVVLRETYDLSVDAERRRFETLRTNDTAREEWVERFRRRVDRAAARAENRTGREMEVTRGVSRVLRTETTGQVRVRITWEGLARVDPDGAVVVTEPFASGFDPNRALVIRGPEGFARRAATPTPAVRRPNAAAWTGDADLDGFEARFVAGAGTPTPTPTPTTGGGGDGTGDGGGGRGTTVPPGGTSALLGAATLALVPAVLAALGIRRARR